MGYGVSFSHHIVVSCCDGYFQIVFLICFPCNLRVFFFIAVYSCFFYFLFFIFKIIFYYYFNMLILKIKKYIFIKIIFNTFKETLISEQEINKHEKSLCECFFLL